MCNRNAKPGTPQQLRDCLLGVQGAMCSAGLQPVDLLGPVDEIRTVFVGELQQRSRQITRSDVDLFRRVRIGKRCQGQRDG